jgi:hypothetical protein
MEDGFYIELLSFWTDDHDAHRRNALLQMGGGLIEFMLTSNDIEQDIAAANSRGAAYTILAPGRRMRPDGTEIHWIDGPTKNHTAAIPALIQDVTDRVLRVPDGEARQHDNGIQGLARLTLVVADLAQTVDSYVALLNRTPEPMQMGGSALFSIGPHRIELHQPPPHSEMSDHLATFGDSPYAARFYGDQSYHIQNIPGGAEVVSGAKNCKPWL